MAVVNLYFDCSLLYGPDYITVVVYKGSVLCPNVCTLVLSLRAAQENFCILKLQKSNARHLCTVYLERKRRA